MKFWKQTFPFLLLNIVVSAATVFAVLSLWDRAHPLPTTSTRAPQPEVVASDPSPTVIPTLRPAATLGFSLSIEGIFGAGDIATEYVLIQNQGDFAINLQGWKLSGGNQSSFTFPNLNLNRDGAIRLYSKNGPDSVIELYWGSDSSLWHSGDKLKLVDASGIIQATYTIP